MGVVMANPRGKPPKYEDIHQPAMVSKPIRRPVRAQVMLLLFVKPNLGLPLKTKTRRASDKIPIETHFTVCPWPKRCQENLSCRQLRLEFFSFFPSEFMKWLPPLSTGMPAAAILLI